MSHMKRATCSALAHSFSLFLIPSTTDTLQDSSANGDPTLCTKLCLCILILLQMSQYCLLCFTLLLLLIKQRTCNSIHGHVFEAPNYYLSSTACLHLHAYICACTLVFACVVAFLSCYHLAYQFTFSFSTQDFKSRQHQHSHQYIHPVMLSTLFQQPLLTGTLSTILSLFATLVFVPAHRNTEVSHYSTFFRLHKYLPLSQFCVYCQVNKHHSLRASTWKY